MGWVETVTNVLFGLEMVAAVVLTYLNFREVRFLEQKVRPLLDEGEDLPLFDALTARGRYVTFVAIYFIALTAFGAFVGPISELFPPIRAINGAVLLGLLAGPRVYGAALREKAQVALDSYNAGDHV